MSTARSVVDSVLGRATTTSIWSGSYDKVLPVSFQDFDLAAVLPAVFYMFRFGHRRGKGQFVETFGSDTGSQKERRRSATVDSVARVLSADDNFAGFTGPTEQAILADLLLCFALENTKRALGRHEQVQRIAPTHYMSSWVDLPDRVVNLRYVPEMIVALLANQEGEYIEQNDHLTRFAVGRGFEDNVLLKAFHHGVYHDEGPLADLAGDRFDERARVGLDQLLTIRLAQKLGSAPEKLRGGRGDGERISNQRPICEAATRAFSDDLRRFVRGYSDVLPRHAFVDLLESCLAIGLTSIAASVVDLLFEWADVGTIRDRRSQRPPQLFADCSNGVDRSLRSVAEQSFDDFTRRIERLPVILMALRLLDHYVRHDRKLKQNLPPSRPYATQFVNLLGDILFDRHPNASSVLSHIELKGSELEEGLMDDYPEAAALLANDRVQPNPVWRLAESLTYLQGRKNALGHVVRLFDSALHLGRPNGIGAKRTVVRKSPGSVSPRKSEVRSLVLSDSALEYLVHLLVLPPGNQAGYSPLPLGGFIEALRKRYGFCIDAEPLGMTISADTLRSNRLVLERRLRDLGLLQGVNDAESMKYLRPRFERQESA